MASSNIAYATRRSCRAYRSRLLETFGKAVGTWCYLFQQQAPKFEPTSDNCADLSREAKAYLAACPTEDQAAAFAWNSIKKLQPASCRCMEAPLINSVASHFKSPAPTLPTGYIEFARKIVRSLFPHGWDSGSYEDKVYSVDPPLSACVENRRGAGGVHGFASNLDSSSATAAQLAYNQPEFVHGCLEGVNRRLSSRSYLTVVQSAGKPRPLSKFSADALHLKPLHKAIYDHISKMKWLCRGDFDTDALTSAGFSYVKGETLTSGDYKSATDNLSIEVAEAILDELLKLTVSVPGSIKAYAMRILRPTLYNLEHDISDFIPSRGQMMGSVLSFPLLCLQNRIAFLWSGHSVGIDVSDFPCLINGDDILFRSGPRFSEHWMRTVSLLSLEVERTKTSVSPEYGSLNSTLCRRFGSRYRVVATVRMGMLRESESLDSLARGFDGFIAGLKGCVRYRAAMAWFSWNIMKIRPLGLTTLDLGFRGPLAYRASKKFGLTIGQSFQKVPSLRFDNGLDLTSSGCEFVDPASLQGEEKKISLYELASWKWRTRYNVYETAKAKVKFMLAISATRRDCPSFVAFRTNGFESHVTSMNTGGVGLFCSHSVKPERGFPLLIPREDRLPSYDEVAYEIGEADVGSVEPFAKDKK